MLNEVVFNQVLTKGGSEHETKSIIEYIQHSGKAWLGGTTWQDEAAIRISICSWMTTEDDLDILLDLFEDAKNLNQ